jgi:hypothetical protein
MAGGQNIWILIGTSVSCDVLEFFFENINILIMTVVSDVWLMLKEYCCITWTITSYLVRLIDETQTRNPARGSLSCFSQEGRSYVLPRRRVYFEIIGSQPRRIHDLKILSVLYFDLFVFVSSKCLRLRVNCVANGQSSKYPIVHIGLVHFAVSSSWDLF